MKVFILSQVENENVPRFSIKLNFSFYLGRSRYKNLMKKLLLFFFDKMKKLLLTLYYNILHVFLRALYIARLSSVISHKILLS